MARKSRRNTENTTVGNIAEKSSGKVYRAALYARLSVEDERKIECESVENQIKLLRDFVNKTEDIIEADLYVDRGVTGTKFDRPEFNRMVADMRVGKFNCIIVKDLSRLGRNYLETGNYLESIFPIFGIRFISVTDHYDSLTAKASEDGLIVPLKNLINEAYAKDISRKVSSSVLERQKQGKHICGRAPYGYIKDPEDAHHLIPDKEVREVIVRIFEERLSGKSFDKIAAGLNKDNIPAPGKLHSMRGFYKNGKFNDCLWNYSTIRKILKSRVYIGDMVQGATRRALYKNQPTVKVSEDELIVVEGTHEPIVSRDIFDKVQKMFEASEKEAREIRARQEPINMPDNLFDGVFVCGDCGRKMHYKTSRNHGHRVFCYVCPSSGSYGELCSAKYISKRKLDETVGLFLKQQIETYGQWALKAEKINSEEKGLLQLRLLRCGISEMEKKVDDITSKSMGLYGDFADGLITEDDYVYARKHYQREIEDLKHKINAKRAEASHYEAGYGGDPVMEKAYRESAGFDVLTKDIVKALIRKIRYFGKGRMEIQLKYEDELEAFISEIRERCADEGQKTTTGFLCGLHVHQTFGGRR